MAHYLPGTTETKQGLDLMAEEFITYGTCSVITANVSYEQAERDIGRKADKNRKIYNGMMKAYYYQFLGPKPPRSKG